MHTQEEIREQMELLEVHRRTLAVYLRQQATIGEHYSPPALINGIRDVRLHIERIKQRLQSVGVEVRHDPDDEALPLLPPLPSRLQPRLIVWLLAGALGAVFAMGSFAGAIRGLFENGQRDMGTTATPSTASADVVFSAFTFQDGTDMRWNGEPSAWSVVAEGTEYIYRAVADTAETASTPPDDDVLITFDDYAVEMRVRVVQPGPVTDDLADFWVTVRADYERDTACTHYNFAIFSVAQRGSVSLSGEQPCKYILLKSDRINFVPNQWYTLRIEVVGQELRMLIDGQSALVANDDTLRRGFFFVTVGPGTTVDFDDVIVYRLARSGCHPNTAATTIARSSLDHGPQQRIARPLCRERIMPIRSVIACRTNHGARRATTP